MCDGIVGLLQHCDHILPMRSRETLPTPVTVRGFSGRTEIGLVVNAGVGVTVHLFVVVQHLRDLDKADLLRAQPFRFCKGLRVICHILPQRMGDLIDGCGLRFVQGRKFSI